MSPSTTVLDSAGAQGQQENLVPEGSSAWEQVGCKELESSGRGFESEFVLNTQKNKQNF